MFNVPRFSLNNALDNRAPADTKPHRVAGRVTRGDAGLTLVEIVVVIIILVTLFAFLGGGLFSGGTKALARLNELKMSKLKAYIDQYMLNYGTPPPALDTLVSCQGAPQGRPCTPFAQAEDIQDAWATPFVYQADQGGRRYTIKSLGADKKDGGAGADADVILQGP